MGVISKTMPCIMDIWKHFVFIRLMPEAVSHLNTQKHTHIYSRVTHWDKGGSYQGLMLPIEEQILYENM